MYKIMFKDNWDSHDDGWYDLTDYDFTLTGAQSYIDLHHELDRANGEENRWSYTMVKN